MTAEPNTTEKLMDEIQRTPEEYLPLLLRLVQSFREGVTNDEEMESTTLARLKKDIQAGIESLDQGKGIPFNADSIKARGRERLAANRR